MSSVGPLRRSRHRYTYEEYVAYERDSGLKHEYEDGEILALAGGSRRHNALASRISGVLEVARKPGCVAFQSDQKVRILATGKATYPDASLVCGIIEGDPADPEPRSRTRFSSWRCCLLQPRKRIGETSGNTISAYRR